MAFESSVYNLLDEPQNAPPLPATPQNDTSSGVDPLLETALIQQESRGNANAVSYAGAKGVGQLMDRTGMQLAAARGEKYNPYDPVQNKELSTDYLGQQLKDFGSEDLALTAYNAGPAKLRRLHKLAGSNNLEDVLKIPESEGGLKGEQRTYAQEILARREKLN